MGLFSDCLFGCDIDGTLLVNGIINPRNIEKIEYFISEGGYFSLCTGRTVGAVSPVLEKIKNISPSVVANGCMIYDFETQDVHAGGSGCGCVAVTLCGYVFEMMKKGELNDVLILGTGALLSPTSSLQGESVPGIAHAISLSTTPGGGKNGLY